MPKAKTFWVYRHWSFWVSGRKPRNSADAVVHGDYVCIEKGNKYFGRLKLGELKQLKITEVKG